LLNDGDEADVEFEVIERLAIGIFGLIGCRLGPEINAARP